MDDQDRLSEKVGDRYEGISGSTIVSRSSVNGSFNSSQQNLNEDILKAILSVKELINQSKDPVALAIYEQFDKELQKPDRDKDRLKKLWDGLVKNLPAVAEMAEAVSKIVSLLG
jgi:hypothetical protein